MNKQFNVYDNIYTPKTTEFTTITDWLNLIKESEYSDVILQARKFGEAHKMYDSLKKTVPAITYNFIFDGYKKNDNIIADKSTGLIYIDVDIDFDIQALGKSKKIFSMYKSFGGLGYALLVQVNGLTINNYDATYQSICNELGLKYIFDKNAKKKTQFNVLSYDPDIFINYDSFVFDSVENVLSSGVTTKEETYIAQLSTNPPSDKSIRLSNLYEGLEFEDYDCIYDFEIGFEYISCWIPFKNKVKESNRNNSLLSYCNNLLWLNPHLTFTGALKIMNRVNNQLCEVPVDEYQIKSVVTGIYKQKENGTLKPIVNRKKRKIVFAPFSLLTAEQKFAKSRELVAEHKTSGSKQKINQILEDWDFDANGKITIRGVVNIGKMGNNTVTKYWSEFKEHVAVLNKNRGHAQPPQEATEQAKYINDTLLSEDDKVSQKSLKREFKLIKNMEKIEPQIKPSEAINVPQVTTLADIRKDDLEDFFVANSAKYQRALKGISATPKVMMNRNLRKLLADNYEGEEVYDAGDVKLTFNIYPKLNTIEFKAVA